jgi:hypothetical protein
MVQMKRRWRLVITSLRITAFLLTAAVLSACAEHGAAAGSGGSGNTGGPASPSAGRAGGPRLVSPRPGLRDVRPIHWAKATAGPDGRTLTVAFWAEPCLDVDHVGLAEAGSQVVVTLYVGAAPSDGSQPCIQSAEYQAVSVSLTSPLGGRTVVDGAPPASPGPPGPGPSVSPSPP